MSEVIEKLIGNARKAMDEIKDYDQKDADRLVQAIAWSIYQDDHALTLAKISVKDSGLGKVQDKFSKNKRKTFGTLRDLLKSDAKSVGLISNNPKAGIVEYAKPVGVIAAVVPSTNPAATPANKAMMAVKGKNAIIFAPSPKGASSCEKLIEYIHQEFDKINAPRNLVQMLPIPVSKELTNELIKAVDLVTVTGSQRNVRNGQTCGTPNVCVGKGNVVTIIDSSANIPKAVELITASKTFDNATSCSSDNSIVIEDDVYDEVVKNFEKEGAYLCNEEEKERLKKVMWDQETGKRRSQTTAKDIDVMLDAAGITVAHPEQKTFIMVEESNVGEDFPFSGEKLALVASVYRAKDFEDALNITERILNYQGKGHSCGLHTTDESHIQKIGLRIPVCRIMINQAQAFGNGGNFNNGMNFTLSMGGGTWAGNNIGENLSYKHFINITKVSTVIPENKPSEEELFGSYWEVIEDK